MTTKINVDSVENQKIRGMFVARQVKTCFSYEMTEILRSSNEENELPTWEDIENLYEYHCPDCGGTVEEKVSDDTRSNGGQIFNCDSCEYTAPDTEMCDQEPQEIFEWWIVTEWFYDKLKERNHPVLEWGNNYYWGRCTTGQAIAMDSVIADICLEMEILAGQKYSWEEK